MNVLNKKDRNIPDVKRNVFKNQKVMLPEVMKSQSHCNPLPVLLSRTEFHMVVIEQCTVIYFYYAGRGTTTGRRIQNKIAIAVPKSALILSIIKIR